MVQAPSSSYTLKYDAWNRLVEVKDGTVVQANEYDGLNRRLIRDESSGSGLPAAVTSTAEQQREKVCALRASKPGQ